MKLTDRINELEQKIGILETKISDLIKKTEAKRIKPESRVPQIDLSKIGAPFPSTETGLGRVWGKQANIVFNDADGKLVPWGQQPPEPKKGFNKHSHSRYAGGALDITTLELVEYETNEDGIILDSEGNPVNKHCQAYWKIQPNIKKAEDGITEKIGLLDIEFDPSSKKWVTGSNIIDVERTYLAQYVWKKEGEEVPPGTEGATREIKKDQNGNEMKAPIYGPEENIQNAIWDKNAECWRFYAVYADEEE